MPSLTGALAGSAVPYVLSSYVRSARLTPSEAAEVGAAAPEGLGRRRFVLATTGALVASTGAGLLERRLNATSAAEAEASRAAVRLPAPASPAPPLARGVDLRIRKVAPFTTPNRDFYRVDTALRVPRLAADRWRLRLRLHGKSRHPAGLHLSGPAATRPDRTRHHHDLCL